MSSAGILRAMAANYASGHSWDHLDTEACVKAADRIEQLEAEVAEIKNASDGINPTDEKFIALGEQVVELTQQLAASQLREQQLRDKLSPYPRLAYNTGFFHLKEFFEGILALPSDTTVLESLIAKIGEVVVTKAKQACIDLGAKGIDYFNYTSFVEAIDNLPTITLEDINK